MAAKSKQSSVKPRKRASSSLDKSQKSSSSSDEPRKTSSRGEPRRARLRPRGAHAPGGDSSHRVLRPTGSVTEPEVKTMDALLAKYGRKVEALERGTKVRGKVISKSSKRLILDIDRKSEGLVAEKAFTEAKDFIRSLKIGDEVTASVIVSETPEGYTVLSLRQAQQDVSWEKILQAQKNNSHLVVLGRGQNSSGVTVDVEGLIGFVPRSQLGRQVAANPKALIGAHFKVIVVEADKQAKKIILSEKEVSEAEDIELVKKALAKIKMGEVYEACVNTVVNFGIFAQIEITLGKNKKTQVEGLVHISEMSWDKVESPSDMVSEGDKVKVKVIGTEVGRLALSIKQAQDDPWLKAEKKYGVDSKHKGKVVRVSDFGVFVQLEPGIEGLVHMTKIPPGERLEKGQETNVYVEEINVKQKKLSLGLVLTAKPVGYK